MSDNDWDNLVDANEQLRTMRREFKRQTADSRKASDRGRKTQRKGKAGEQAAERVLRTMGFKCIEPVGKHVHLTPVDAKRGIEPVGKHVHRGQVDAKRGIYRVKFIKKLPGDFTAVGHDGISVLVEVKHIDGRETLRWSDLRKSKPGHPGQAACLTKHHEAGGLSLLIWVHDYVWVLEWPVVGFGPGRKGSLTLERAKELAILLRHRHLNIFLILSNLCKALVIRSIRNREAKRIHSYSTTKCGNELNLFYRRVPSIEEIAHTN